MAEETLWNQEQLNRLLASVKENNGCKVWNEWREKDNFQTKINLSGASLIGLNLYSVNLSKATLIKTDLRGVNMVVASLNEADLSQAYLNHANLTQINLSKTNLHKANLSGADLSKGDLSGANLIEANLSKAYLIEAKLIQTNLSRVNLSGTNLKNADFSGASPSKTIFIGIDLSEARGLDFINHQGPSHLSTDSLQKSKGQISEIFLRGCGLSDLDIEYSKLYNPELTTEEINQIGYKIIQLRADNPIQLAPCFISYTDKDKEFTHKTYETLQQKGVRCWFAQKDIKIGRIKKQIDKAISLNDKLILIVSEHSLKSKWVKWEIKRVLKREKEENREIIFPIMLDNTVMTIEKGWGAKLRQYVNIGDFANWKNSDSFDISMQHLLKSLGDEKRDKLENAIEFNEKDWFLEEEEYTPEEIECLVSYLKDGISEPEKIEQICFYSKISCAELKFNIPPKDIWFRVLKYAMALVEEDYIALLVEKSLSENPKNKYLLQAKELIEKHYEED